jgi:hypothetical protein
MRKLAITLAGLTTLALAAAAYAALPQKGPFAGKTGLHSINGFVDLVTFTASPNGKSLRKFTFGTLGCFGHGSYPVGTDPYADPTNTALMKTIPVDANGTFTLKGIATLADPQGIVTTATVTGAFTSTSAVSGTITLSQTDNGDACGPQKMKFSATSGTPTSLGLNGG